MTVCAVADWDATASRPYIHSRASLQRVLETTGVAGPISDTPLLMYLHECE